MICEACGKTLLVSVGFFFLAFTAQGQCLEKGHFTYCPDRDTLYVLTDKHLEAFHVSENRVSWRTELPKIADNGFEDPIVTVDSVVVSAGFPTTRILAFDAKTGKPSWQVDSSILSETAIGPYVFLADARHWEGLTALEGGTGKLVWHHTAGRPGDINFLHPPGRFS
jgi:outer membrane protein assembly factor BamB